MDILEEKTRLREEMLRIRNDLNTILSATTGKNMQEVEDDTDRDNFMTAEEAKAYGLVDIIENRL